MALCHLMVKNLPLCCNLDAVAVHHRLDCVPDLAICYRNKQHAQTACLRRVCEHRHLTTCSLGSLLTNKLHLLASLRGAGYGRIAVSLDCYFCSFIGDLMPGARERQALSSGQSAHLSSVLVCTPAVSQQDMMLQGCRYNTSWSAECAGSTIRQCALFCCHQCSHCTACPVSREGSVLP